MVESDVLEDGTATLMEGDVWDLRLSSCGASACVGVTELRGEESRVALDEVFVSPLASLGLAVLAVLAFVALKKLTTLSKTVFDMGLKAWEGLLPGAKVKLVLVVERTGNLLREER